MPLINYKISLQLKWSKKCIILAGTVNNQSPIFQITDTKCQVPVVTLLTQENTKLASGYKRTINYNKYLAKIKNQARNRYLDNLIDPKLQGVNRLFVLSLKDDDGRESHEQYCFPTVEIKDYNVMINERNFFDQPIKNFLKTHKHIRKIVTGQGDDYTTGCFLDYPYFKKYFKLIAIDLNKQQKLDAD